MLDKTHQIYQIVFRNAPAINTTGYFGFCVILLVYIENQQNSFISYRLMQAVVVHMYILRHWKNVVLSVKSNTPITFSFFLFINIAISELQPVTNERSSNFIFYRGIFYSLVPDINVDHEC